MEQIEQKISSREVAKMMEVEHKVLLRKIDSINKDFGMEQNCTNQKLVEQNCATKKYWSEGTFKYKGRTFREFQITKRGCEFLAHKTTGTKGNLFTDRYMDKFEEMKEVIAEQPVRRLTAQEIMREQLSMIDEVSERVDKLEDTMVIDYGQQRVLERLVASAVIGALGGKESVAYKEISKKVFSECNRDIKDYFLVNSRNNIPRIKFNDACKYIQIWQPCTKTRLLIINCNAQMSIA